MRPRISTGWRVEGVRFTQAYAMPVCSPTRASILTGRHAARLHYTIWREGALGVPHDQPLLPPPAIADLPSSEVTIAEVLKGAGYLTFHVGKWHLGDAAHSPETQGFDLNIGGTHWGAPATYFYPFRGPSGSSGEFRYVPGLGLGKPGDYLDDRLTDEALKLIDEARDRPFFLNLCFHVPHTPIEGKARLVEHYQSKLKPGLHHRNPGYAAMVQTLDENVGRVLAKLKQRRLADHTLVIFASDNGGYVNTNRGLQVTDNSPLRSGKGSLYEGGIRVPLIVRMPGVTPPGATCDEPVICTDFFPTILELCGLSGSVQPAPLQPLDGLSLVPLLKQPRSTPPSRRALLSLPPLLPHHHAGQRGALGRLEAAGVFPGPSRRTLLPPRRPRRTTRLGRRTARARRPTPRAPSLLVAGGGGAVAAAKPGLPAQTGESRPVSKKATDWEKAFRLDLVVSLR